jgi:hypothetical protein
MNQLAKRIIPRDADKRGETHTHERSFHRAKKL